MVHLLIYSIVSVILVSIISLIGVFFVPFKNEKIKNALTFFISFAAGALLGDVFIHLLPELSGKIGFGVQTSIFILSGIAFSFIVEKIIHWRHCHYYGIEEGHKHALPYMNLFGDGVHNFIDGLIIGGSYLVNFNVGVATTVAVALHEIPQEVGDFAILIHGGFSKRKALMYNFLVALTAIVGAALAYFLASSIDGFSNFLLGFAAGAFIYIAGSDLIPELHKELNILKSMVQLLTFICGIAIMFGLLAFG